MKESKKVKIDTKHIYTINYYYNNKGEELKELLVSHYLEKIMLKDFKIDFAQLTN